MKDFIKSFFIVIHFILLLHKDNVHWYITELEILQATGYNVGQSIFCGIENDLLMFLPLIVITLRIYCLLFSSLLFNFLLELKYVALDFFIKCYGLLLVQN